MTKVLKSLGYNLVDKKTLNNREFRIASSSTEINEEASVMGKQAYDLSEEYEIFWNRASYSTAKVAEILSSATADIRIVTTDEQENGYLVTLGVDSIDYYGSGGGCVPLPCADDKIFIPLYVLLNDVKITVNQGDPYIIMQGDVDVLKDNTRLQIDVVISSTFNYVVGIAIYLDDVAIGTGSRNNDCHDDCAFVNFNNSSNSNFMSQSHCNLVTDELNKGIHNIKIGILGKWNGNAHTIFVGDSILNNKPSSSTLIVKEFK